MLRGSDISLHYLGRLDEFVGANGKILLFLDELLSAPEPISYLEEAVKDVGFFKRKQWESPYQLGLFRLALYTVIRARSPRLVIETGVLHGITSNFILCALVRNGRGELVSIDLPSYAETGPANKDGYRDTLPPGKQPGWVVPDSYRRAWTLRLGRSVEVLPMLDSHGIAVDLFIHDSEHTYETMQAELAWAWQRLSKDGVLFCDNIDANSAFRDFCEGKRLKPLLMPEAIDPITSLEAFRFGIIRKGRTC